MRIALFTPVSPVRSGLVSHIESLLPLLVESLDITVVLDGSYRPTHRMFSRKKTTQVAWISYVEFVRTADQFDLVIYQLGDEGDIHGYMLDAMPRYPGLVLLHDLVLHHAIVRRTLDQGNPDAYTAEMRYSYGSHGERIANEVMAGNGRIDLNRYPLIDRVLESSLALVGFNAHMCDIVGTMRPDLSVRQMPLHLYEPDGFPTDFCRREYREEIGLGDRLVVATLGLYSPNNRLDVALRAFSRLVQVHPNAHYLLVGEPADRASLQRTIGALGIGARTSVTGWVGDDDFFRYMHVPDVAVQLRYPHAGGTCYPQIRLLGLGVPTIISDIPTMAEIPADAILRIPPDHPDEELLLSRAMDRLLADEAISHSLSRNALRYAREHHSKRTAAKLLVGIIDEVYANRRELRARIGPRRRRKQASMAARAKLTPLLGRALAELGVSDSDSQLLPSIARVVRDLGSSSLPGASERPID